MSGLFASVGSKRKVGLSCQAACARLQPPHAPAAPSFQVRALSLNIRCGIVKHIFTRTRRK